jgi:GT2 family glycosyltransferase
MSELAESEKVRERSSARLGTPSLVDERAVDAHAEAQTHRRILSVVVVAYHSMKTCREELSLLAKCAARHDEVDLIVVDNSVDADESRQLRQFVEPNGIVIAPQENLGFAGGCNLGVQESESDWVLLLNPDVRVEAAQFSTLISFVSTLGVDVFSATGVLKAGGVEFQGIELLFNVWFRDRRSDSARSSIGPSGGFAIFHRTTYLSIGGLNTEYFAWGEDCEFALRAQRRSLKNINVPVVFSHRGGHSVSSKDVARRRAYSLAINRLRIAKEYYSRRQFVQFVLIWGLLFPGRLVQNLRRGTAVADLCGFLDGLLNIRTGDRFRWPSK